MKYEVNDAVLATVERTTILGDRTDTDQQVFRVISVTKNGEAVIMCGDSCGVGRRWPIIGKFKKGWFGWYLENG